MPASTGGHTTLYYRFEDQGFGADPSSDEDPKPFGGNATISSQEGSNNALDVFQPNDREREQLIAQRFEGSATIDFEITNPWWLGAVIAAPSTTDNGDGTYTHTFDGQTPLPMRVYIGYEDPATSSDGPELRELVGYIVQTATIDTSVEEGATVSLTGAYADEQIDDTIADLPPQPELQYDVMTFVDAALSLDGQTIRLAQDASLDIENNTDIIPELGTRVGVDYSPKGRMPSIDYTTVQIETDPIREMYGDAAADAVQESVNSGEPMTFTLDNGEAAGSGLNQIQFNLGGQFPESHSNENIGDPQEDLQASINRALETVAAESTNETASAP